MIVLDTNLLVRLATNDAPAERAAVIDILSKHECLISKTVLLETEWVLRSRYGYNAEQFAEFAEYLLALSSLSIEDESVVRWAVDAARTGIDFADAMHVSIAVAAEEPFYTFDKKLLRKASKLKGVRIHLVGNK
jgi:predicted nucleic-acid-binding protein